MGHIKGLTLHFFAYACGALPMHLQLTTYNYIYNNYS